MCIFTPVTRVAVVGGLLAGAAVTMLATTTVAIDTAEHARAVLRLVDLLDDNDDIQDVHANFDIPAEILEALDG